MQQIYFLLIISLILVVSGCSKPESTELNGTIENGDAEFVVLEFEPIHYKFAPPMQVVSDVCDRGNFNFNLKLDEPKAAKLKMHGSEMPIVLKPHSRLNLNIRSSRFPQDVQYRGSGSGFHQDYQRYLKRAAEAERHMRSERRNFLRSEPNDYMNVLRLRNQLAKEYLAGTPYEFVMKRNIGEYLVARLEQIRMNKLNPHYDASIARRAVLNEALHLDFFTLESLKAQRAGIRDFTDAWSKTYGVQHRLEQKYDRKLMEYDWKRLGYKELDEYRSKVLEYIDDPEARAHAEMYLIAERLGEGDFEHGAETLENFKSNYPDKISYIGFLENLKSDVERVQPGNPGIDFNLTDENGETFNLDDFKGHFVLLDIWASWCVPCLEEFPYMEEIHREFKDHDLKIVSVSIDEERETWINALERDPHPWVQLFAGEGFDHELVRSYRAGGIPFYVLLDRNGDIIRLNDIRPSFNFREVFQDVLYNELQNSYALH